MLAAQDQENLFHGHQAQAAAKPLNRGTRQLAPKTPGDKVPKTPFKLPLNDENGKAGLGAGKTAFKPNGGGKNAFVTPMGKLSSWTWERRRAADRALQAPRTAPHWASKPRMRRRKCCKRQYRLFRMILARPFTRACPQKSRSPKYRMRR